MPKKNKRCCHSPKRQPANRRHKDRLFRMVFQDKKDLLELYNALNGTDYRNPDDLTITTLEDVLFLGMKNDLSFIIGATLNLYEHQSTWNNNMPLRGLLYFAGLFQEYVDRNDYNLYGRRLIPLPFPQYLVFYNGDEEEPDETELSLSKAFPCLGKNLTPGVDCRVRVLNINRGHNRELMENCRRLWEYAEFTALIRNNLQKGQKLQKAINAAIDDCQKRGILADLLSRCRTEVLHMLLTEYDEKKTMDYLRREAREIGEELGQEIGEKLGQEIGEKRGREIGEKLGQEIGERRGREIGEKLARQYAAQYAAQYVTQINELNARLIHENRYEELNRSLQDAEYQKQLLEEYGIAVTAAKQL